MKRVTKWIRPAAIACAIAATVSTPVSIHAQVRSRTPIVYFGMAGIVRGESARLSVSNVLVDPPEPDLPPGPCRVTISFVDGSGNTLMGPDGRPVSRTVTLQPGQSAFLQISADDFLSRTTDAVGAGRLNFRPVVSVQPASNRIPPDPCIPSLEILDTASMQTKLVLPGVASAAININHNETLVVDGAAR